jgi:hypothetical protein
MFDEFRDLFRGFAAMTAASMRATQEQHNDQMARSKVAEEIEQARVEREIVTTARSLELEERQVVAWERAASALERLADKA